jgi:LDH2 family malate/lactate/ureidoglycolate dehydrogenase
VGHEHQTRAAGGEPASAPSGLDAVATPSSVQVSSARLEGWAVAVLVAAGASPQAARTTAHHLVDANRRGVDSHGVLLLRLYLPRLANGAVDGRTSPRILVDLPALAVIDGRRGLGAMTADFAMRLCCDKAEAVGAAAVLVRNSSHFGAASCFANLGAERGCAAIVMSNSDPGMAPLGALQPVLGTNPIAIAAPGADANTGPSLDFATSVVALARVRLAALTEAPIPDEWAIDSSGQPTTDPREALLGAMLPMGGHKGFALAFMIDVFAGCLAGAGLSPSISGDPYSSAPENTGHCMLCVHLGQAIEQDSYQTALRELRAAVEDAPRAPGTAAFLTPGEREAADAAHRRKAIPFDAESLSMLQRFGQEFGVPFPA